MKYLAGKTAYVLVFFLPILLLFFINSYFVHYAKICVRCVYNILINLKRIKTSYPYVTVIHNTWVQLVDRTTQQVVFYSLLCDLSVW